MTDVDADDRSAAQARRRRLYVHRGQKSRLQEEIPDDGRQRATAVHGERVQLHQRTRQGSTVVCYQCK